MAHGNERAATSVVLLAEDLSGPREAGAASVTQSALAHEDQVASASVPAASTPMSGPFPTGEVRPVMLAHEAACLPSSKQPHEGEGQPPEGEGRPPEGEGQPPVGEGQPPEGEGQPTPGADPNAPEMHQSQGIPRGPSLGQPIGEATESEGVAMPDASIGPGPVQGGEAVESASSARPDTAALQPASSKWTIVREAIKDGRVTNLTYSKEYSLVSTYLTK